MQRVFLSEGCADAMVAAGEAADAEAGGTKEYIDGLYAQIDALREKNWYLKSVAGDLLVLMQLDIDQGAITPTDTRKNVLITARTLLGK